MANYEVVEFVAIMQHIIEKFTIFFFLANKEIKRKSGLRTERFSVLKNLQYSSNVRSHL